MKLIIEIECGNAAFDDGQAPAEVGMILRTLAGDIQGGEHDAAEALLRGVSDVTRLFDTNGNSVGTVKVEA